MKKNERVSTTRTLGLCHCCTRACLSASKNTGVSRVSSNDCVLKILSINFRRQQQRCSPTPPIRCQPRRNANKIGDAIA